MPNAITGGDFEAAGLWVELRSSRVSDFVHGGAWAERMQSVRPFGAPLEATITQTSSGLTGQQLTPRFWVRADADGVAGTAELYLVGSSSPAGAIDTFYEFVPISSFVAGVWTEVVFSAITLPCDTPTLGLWLSGPTSPSPTTCTIRVDDFEISSGPGAAVAVMGIELPLRALLATLQANLNAELVHVGNEANDSLAPMAVEGWRCWKTQDLAVNRCRVDVYEIGGTTFPDWDEQMSTWLSGQRVPLRHQANLVVAVLFANRGLTPTSRTLKMSEMRVLAMRYAVGVVRTIRNTPNLGLAGIFCEPGEASITYGLDEVDGPPASMRVEVPAVVRVSESSSGETSVGGGTRPSAILES